MLPCRSFAWGLDNMAAANLDIVIEQGLPGADGTDGVDGVGVNAGGTTGQVLAKASNADFDTEWIDDIDDCVVLA